MIQLLNRKDINPEKWNACISSSKHPLFYFLFEVMDIASNQKWEALVEDDYKNVFPLPYNYKIGLKYYYTPFWIQKTGWINPEPLHYNIDNYIKADYIDLFTQNLSAPNLNDRINWILNLDTDLNYSSNTKRNIKKSTLPDIKIYSLSPNAKNFTRYFRINKGQEISNINDEAYIRLEKIINYLDSQNMSDEFQVIKDGEILSKGIFIRFNNTYTYFKGCSSLNAKNTGAGHSLIDHAIRYAQNIHFKTFDFYGGHDIGMAQFYSGFGAKPLPYAHFVKNNLPKPLRWLKK